MILSYSRGHRTYFKRGEWYFLDTHEKDNGERACKRCGRKPTKDGFDACLGHVKGAKSACCGHGTEQPYVVMK